MAAIWRQTFDTLARRLPVLVALLLVVDGPILVLEALLGARSGVDGREAGMMTALLWLLATPLVNGAVLAHAVGLRKGRPLSFAEGLREGLRAWRRLFLGYFAVGLVVIGWLGIGLVPGVLLMRFLELESLWWLAPFVLPALFMLARYGFMESLIVAGGMEAYDARQESIRLTRGIRLQILAAGLVLIAPALALELATPEVAARVAADQATRAALQAAITLCGGFVTMIYLVFFYHWFVSLTAHLEKGPQP